MTNSTLHDDLSLTPNSQSIRCAFLSHLRALYLQPDDHFKDLLSKSTIRKLHALQREERDAAESRFVRTHTGRLLHHFANGCQITPARIDPELVVVESGTEDAALFRLATLLWSIPVSRGFGRRMRFLIRDRHNGKLIGLLALGSPVFNLHARDAWIGWDVRARERRLTRIMDAYVLGAVPPYNTLLGGKLVGALAASAEVAAHFAYKYDGVRGRISGRKEHPHLALITTTSALGRSSVYNRLRLCTPEGRRLVGFRSVGYTIGHGHFHVPAHLFDAMRQLLIDSGRSFAACGEFGSGPNRRLRIFREALEIAGVDPALARHGIRREIFVAPLVPALLHIP